MDSKKRKCRINSNTQSDAKPRRSLRIQLAKIPETPLHVMVDMAKIPELPLDVMVNIIVRLPLKFLIRCMYLSKDFKNLISDPEFSHIYLTKKSNYFYTIFVNRSKPEFSLDLVEFDESHIYSKKGNRGIAIFNLDRLTTGGSCSACDNFTVCGYCNGLLCLLKVKSGLYNLFVINPILGDFIQLPEIVFHSPKTISFAYGIGLCQLTNRYKVLGIITEYIGGSSRKYTSWIFIIGCDQNWRSVSDVNVPYNNKVEGHSRNPVTPPSPQTPMVPFHSALHWVMMPLTLSINIRLEPDRGGTHYICAFDLTVEKVSTLPLPRAGHISSHSLSELLDKLCVWQICKNNRDCYVWVMDEYGVEASWTKQFVLKMQLGLYDLRFTVAPLAVSPEGVIVASVRNNLSNKLVFYDMKKKKRLRVVYQSKQRPYLGPFVPCFVSLKNLVQG